MIKGIAASSGIAIGKAFVLPSWEWDMPENDINAGDLANEFERLYDGIRNSKSEINSIKAEISNMIGAEESTIFDAHLAILDDPVFMQEVQGIIQRQYKAAEVAVKEAIDKFTNMFDLLEDEYMRERAIDIKDVGNRLIKHLLGKPEVTLPNDTQPFILVAKELSPSQLAHLNTSHVLGVINMVGGQTSHTAIMARAMGIPLVVGVDADAEPQIKTGDHLVLDGETGLVYLNPDEQIVSEYSRRREHWLAQRERLKQITDVPAVTRDGFVMNLEVNISSLKELKQGLMNGAGGVGLFRTEFVYMDRDALPSEEEQFQIYKQVVDELQGRPIVIRTLDIGGDKPLDYFALPEEDNPFLGYRAIRICLDHPVIFKTQLKAILRASHFGKVSIVYPMISSVEELRKANDLLAQAKRELLEQHIPFDENIKIGAIIELPSAVIIADQLAEEVDFFSIGTNDLIQYTLAVDRMNEHISNLYDAYHPAVIRMIRMIVEAGNKSNIPVGVCGEMASDPLALPIWIGLGLQHLSMSSHSILQVKEGILNLDASACAEILNDIRTCHTGMEIKQLLHKSMDKAIMIGRTAQ